MNRDLLLDLIAVMNHELSPEKSWPLQHAPPLDVEGVVTERKRALEMIEAETEAA